MDTLAPTTVLQASQKLKQSSSKIKHDHCLNNAMKGEMEFGWWVLSGLPVHDLTEMINICSDDSMLIEFSLLIVFLPPPIHYS